MPQFEGLINDRGSKYAVSGAAVKDLAQAKLFLKKIKAKKKYARATHNTWGIIFSDGSGHKSDDGESGAGMIILRMLEREQLFGEIIVVTRWYGGVHLGGDRFRHVQHCVNYYISQLSTKL